MQTHAAVRALIFDMDGTVVDSMPAHAQSWQDFARQHGLSIDLPALMRRTTGRNGVECMRLLFGPSLSEPAALALVAEKEAIYRARFGPQFRSVAGFAAFYAQARVRGLRLGLGSAGDRHNIAFSLAHLDLPQPFDAIVSGDEGLPGKPQPDIFLTAAQRLGVAPEQCIVFEDAPLGIEAARRAGMRAVALCTGHTPQELAGAHVLAAVPDFEALIQTRFLETLHVACS
ncbi:MAG: beta-phosphoglucomutase family hydrolase [Rhodoferax sp.]